MAGEQFQQAHDQRPRQTQQRRRERRTHAAKLLLQPVHQLGEYIQPAFARLRGQRADGLDNRGDRGGQAVKRAQQTQKDQQIGQIARDVPRLVDPGRDRFQNGMRR